MILDWTELPTFVPNMKTWGASKGDYQYVVTYDSLHNIVAATFKYKLGKTQLIGDEFITSDEAKEACIKHFKQSSKPD